MTQETTLMTDAANTTEGQEVDTAVDTATAAVEASQQQPSEQVVAPEAKEEIKPEVAPESYDFKAPEGSVYDPKVISEFSAVAKELNLTQEKAQSVLEKMAPAIKAQQMEQLDTMKNEWAESAKSDKEFGGDKLGESLGYAKKALDAFATPELRTLLEESGLGNHPEIIRTFVKAGKAISEDTFVGGAGTSSSKDARSFYSASNLNP